MYSKECPACRGACPPVLTDARRGAISRLTGPGLQADLLAPADDRAGDGSATQTASSAAAVNGSNRIVLSCPRSADINALTCLDDPY